MIRTPPISAIAFRRLALVAAAVFGAASTPAAQAEGSRAPSAELGPVAGILARSGVEAQPRHVSERIARLGASAVPEIFELLVAEVETSSPSRRHTATLVGALALVPFEPTRRHLRSEVPPSAGHAERRVAVALMGELGSAEDVGFVFSRSYSSEGGPVPELAPALERILRRDDGAWAALSLQLRSAPIPLLAPACEGIAAAESREGMALLARYLELVDEEVAPALRALTRLAERLGPPVPPDAAHVVRRFLVGDDVGLLAAAIGAAGALEDESLVPALIDLLAGGPPILRSRTVASLRRISGEPFPAHADLWRSWYGAQRAWWDSERPAVAAALGSSAPADAIAAIGELATKRLYRHRLAGVLASALEHESEPVQRCACIALGQLGSPLALEPLRLLLDDPVLAPLAGIAIRTLERSGPPGS